jgi:hypothetical protein
VHHITPDPSTSQPMALRVPNPQFSRRALAGPVRRVGPASLEQLWWVHRPEDGRLHLVHPDEVDHAGATGHAQTVCGNKVAAEGFSAAVATAGSGLLCVACVTEVGP